MLYLFVSWVHVWTIVLWLHQLHPSSVCSNLLCLSFNNSHSLVWAYFDVHNSYETDKGMIRKWMMPSVVAFYGSKAGLIVYKSRLMIGRLGLHDGGGKVWKRGEIIYVWTCCNCSSHLGLPKMDLWSTVCKISSGVNDLIHWKTSRIVIDHCLL